MPTNTTLDQSAPRPLGCLPGSADVPQVKAAVRLLTHDGQPLAAFNERGQCISAGAYLDPRRATGEVVLAYCGEDGTTTDEHERRDRELTTRAYADLFATAGWGVTEYRDRDQAGVERLARLILAHPPVRFPVDTAAVYVPDPAEDYRDVVIIRSLPAGSTVEALSARHGKTIRVALDKLQPLPELAPAPEGEITDWWTITDAQGQEITRVQASDNPRARKAAMREARVRAVVRRDKGFAVRRLRSSELAVPVGELRCPSRTA
ncbi:hypothetical protein ABZ023_17840 [Streptomyces sp. NPDC006367]|uniref:hypothetical protein n=1 Tax=unclassified Streptomyces TaxID=2593676 RepID=UPI0033A1326F